MKEIYILEPADKKWRVTVTLPNKLTKDFPSIDAAAEFLVAVIKSRPKG